MLVGKFVRSCAAAVGVLFAACMAHAADLYGARGCGYGGCGYNGGVYVPPPPLWEGFYIGGFAGVARSSVETSTNIIILTSSGVLPLSTIDTTGFLGGGQFGYNFQWGRFLYGLEADLGGLDTGTSVAVTNSSLASLLQTKSSGGFFGDLTMRGGYLFGPALIYAKGGWAFFTGDVRVSDAAGAVNLDSNSFTGWTLGVGAEYMVAPNWTVKAEYQYFDFSNDSGNFGSTITANTFKIGFNWLVHSVPVPLY